MGSQHDQWFDAFALPQHAARFGESIVWLPCGDEAQQRVLPCLVGDEQIDEQPDEMGRINRRLRTLTFERAAVAGCAFAVDETLRDTFIYDGVEYHAERVSNLNSVTIAVDVVRYATIERTRPGFRG